MFFKTTFCTKGNKMPIKSMEDQLTDYYEVEKVIILFFNRIPYGMVKYVDKEMDVDMTFKGE